jgi:hypothetical protein
LVIIAAGTAGPSAYWYLTRGTGVVALLLLTATVVLGVLDVRRVSSPGWPRFLLDRVHRDVSLLVLVVLVVHIVTSVLDGFAPIGVLDAVVPLHSAYRPLWLGLGALSFDLLLAVAITSVVRRRLGHRAWRVVHWLAYASWPIAVLHGLGTGTDARTAWMLAVTAACVAAAVAAAGVRLLGDRPGPRVLLPLWTALCALTPVGVAVLAIAGPLAPRWARRAGTPVAVLRAAEVSRAGVAVRLPPTTATAARMTVPFTARLSGTVSQQTAAGGALVDLVLRCSGAISGELRVRMAGAPLPGAGLSMTGSEVQLTAVGLTSALQGTISRLNGDAFVARVSSAAGLTLQLHASLVIDPSSNTVTGTLTGAQA